MRSGRTSRSTTCSTDLDEPPLLLVLDGVTDPHNLGACLRSADAFGAHAVIVPKDRAVGLNATVAKAASGAAETVPVIAVTNLARTLRDLKERGVWVLGADEAARACSTPISSGPDRLGARRRGPGAAPADARTMRPADRIPLSGAVESLNVSVAAGSAFTRRAPRAAAPLPRSTPSASMRSRCLLPTFARGAP